MRPKISIVIPAYNEASKIEKTLEAVCAQDYPHYEVIVVDNNSSDNTSGIARRFKDVKVLLEERAGVQFARECGRRAATGEFIACLDADCMPPSNWLSDAVRYFKNDRIVAVSGPYNYYDSGSLFRFVTLVWQKIVYVAMHFVIQNIFGYAAVFIFGNAVIRASALNKIGGYDTSIRFYGDDTDTAKRLTTVGRVLFKPGLVVNSSSRRFANQGVVDVLWHYFINFVWVIIFKRPFEKNRDGKTTKSSEHFS